MFFSFLAPRVEHSELLPDLRGSTVLALLAQHHERCIPLSIDRVLASDGIGKLLGGPSRVVVMLGPSGVAALLQLHHRDSKGGMQVKPSPMGFHGGMQVTLLLKLALLLG
eukprot:scaffold16684_cov42-Phaeocystis_antarctica.AAC.2